MQRRLDPLARPGAAARAADRRGAAAVAHRPAPSCCSPRPTAAWCWRPAAACRRETVLAAEFAASVGAVQLALQEGAAGGHQRRLARQAAWRTAPASPSTRPARWCGLPLVAAERLVGAIYADQRPRRRRAHRARRRHPQRPGQPRPRWRSPVARLDAELAPRRRHPRPRSLHRRRRRCPRTMGRAGWGPTAAGRADDNRPALGRAGAQAPRTERTAVGPG